MVLKVSISLPGDSVITFEISEPQFFREVMDLALSELPRNLMQIHMGEITSGEAAKEDKNVIPRSSTTEEAEDQGNGLIHADTSGQLSREVEAEESYAQFCRDLSPMGDMRRVVVVAEGAERFLGTESVSERELGRLFDLAGWRPPGDFLQTLRNAARSKFRWLERVPGRPGYYTITAIGRETVIGPAAV